MNHKKILPVQKDWFCEQLYEKYIVSSAEKLLKYEDYAYGIHAIIPVSCYTNFRDALFHFRKIVFLAEEIEIEQQAFAVKEHLSRALTDASSSILYHLSDVAEELLNGEKIKDASCKRQIREYMHNLKNANLKKRFSGMMIADDMSSISHEEIIILVDAFYCFLNDNCPDLFAFYSNELSKWND